MSRPGAHLPLIGLQVYRLIYHKIHDVLVVKFLAMEHYCPSTTNKLYCLVTEAGVREQLAQGCTQQRRHKYDALQ